VENEAQMMRVEGEAGGDGRRRGEWNGGKDASRWGKGRGR
jgi:hypothetical protein